MKRSDELMTCPDCSHDNEPDSKFCNECGTRMGPAPCGACGETLEAGSKFCRHCGAKAGASAPPAAAAPAVAAPARAAAADPVPRTAPARRPAPTPPPESKTAIWLGVAVAVVGFVWLTVNKQGTPPAPPPVPAASHSGHDHPPAGGAPGAAPAGAGSAVAAGGGSTGGPAISGRITVDDSLKGQTPAGGHFFVIARKAGSNMPMPIAVVRMPAAAGSVPYTLGPEHVMGGGPFIGPFDLSVRWDQDGVVGKQAGDLTGVCAKNPVNPGDVGADVVLTQKI